MTFELGNALDGNDWDAVVSLDQSWFDSDMRECDVYTRHYQIEQTIAKYAFYYRLAPGNPIIAYIVFTLDVHNTTLKIEWLVAPGCGDLVVREFVQMCKATHTLRQLTLTVTIDSSTPIAATNARLYLYLAHGFSINQIQWPETKTLSIQMQINIL